jgi:hypothetical protein
MFWAGQEKIITVQTNNDFLKDAAGRQLKIATKNKRIN